MLSIATWNVNSIRPRLPHLLDFLTRRKPDVVLLQEIKVESHAFPFAEIEELGYNCAVHGQKTYNGVAILSKFPLEEETHALPGDGEDAQSRYIEAVLSLPGTALRVASVYVPNGQEVGSEKFAYKLAFLERLARHAGELLRHEEALVIGGDYNVAPGPLDVHDPAGLDGSVCYHPEERTRLRALLHLGLYDAWRCAYPEERGYSWWDYRAGAWPRNKGMRIDHLLLSPEAADALRGCAIERDERAREKPSDHVPVLCMLDVRERAA